MFLDLQMDLSDGKNSNAATGLKLNTARTGHTATVVLPDRRVLVSGGTGVDGQLIFSAEPMNTRPGPPGVPIDPKNRSREFGMTGNDRPEYATTKICHGLHTPHVADSSTNHLMSRR
jgi:hypothetical protein